MADYAGMTQINAVPPALQEIKGRIVYLAREVASKQLVALQLRQGATPGSMWLEVLRRLDSSLPNLEERCGFCQRPVAPGAKYCSKCGADLTVMPSGSSDEVLEAVKQATGSRYELLGRMEHGTRGGVVFVMRERSSGRLAALRLHKRQEEASGRRVYDLDHTNVMSQVAQDVGAGFSGAPPDSRLLQAVQRTVGTQYEVLGELGRIAEEPPRRPSVVSRVIPAPTPTPAPAAQPTRQRRDDVLWLALAGAAAILLAALGAMWWRSQRPDPGQVAPAALLPPPPPPDSGSIRIGGQLPRTAIVTIDGRRVRLGLNRVAAGSHYLRAEAPGFAAVAESLRVQPDEVTAWGPRLTAGRASGAPPRGR